MTKVHVVRGLVQ